jgi:hypothetical protein
VALFGFGPWCCFCAASFLFRASFLTSDLVGDGIAGRADANPRLVQDHALSSKTLSSGPYRPGSASALFDGGIAPLDGFWTVTLLLVQMRFKLRWN